MGTLVLAHAHDFELKPAAKAAGVEWIAFHAFRHTCASVLFRASEKGSAGLNVKQVQTWLGHHSPAFTLATYIHLIPGDMPDADSLAVLDALTAGGQRGQHDQPRADETDAPAEVAI